MANLMSPITDSVVEGHKRTEALIATIIPSSTNLVGVRSLPERIFVNNFLPYFSGQRDITADDNPFAAWAEVAGTLTSEVAIVNEKNQLLFLVPAIHNTEALSGLNSFKNKEMDIETLVTMANLEKALSPIAAEAGFKNNMANKFNSVNQTSPKQVENEKRWNDIFARYGIVEPQKEARQTANNSNLDPDDMVYD